MASSVSIPLVSREYLHIPWTADTDLDDQTVECCFLDTKKAPDVDTTWVSCSWTGDKGESRTARVLIGPGSDNELAEGSYSVWSRLTDSTERPVRKLPNSLRVGSP
jgi:hypothetical protein